MSNYRKWVRFILFLVSMFIVWYVVILFWAGMDRTRALRVFFTLFIYHVAVRIIWGLAVVDRIPLERFNPDRKRYQRKGFETAYLKKVKVRKWKDSLPVAHPELWDVRERDMDDIVRASCQAEMDHDGNILLSLITIFFARDAASLKLLLFTALSAAFVDYLFVLIQRFNRPRFIRYAEHVERMARSEATDIS